ncbi:MAG: ABC transporter permease [Armatimonadota bacterium]
MSQYIAHRLVSLALVLAVVSVIAFVVTRLAPGDPAGAMLGLDAREEDIEALRKQLGLDRPLVEQFLRWAWLALRGNLGDSIFIHKPVTQAIADRIEPTLLLMTLAEIVALAVGIPAGVISAVRRGSLADQGFTFLTLFAVSVPEFWLGLNLILLFAVELHWLPSSGYLSLAEGHVGTLRYLLMPAVSLGLIHSALIARMTRSTMLEVLNQDYVRTARAKGAEPRSVVYRHALKNAMVPILTVIGLSVAGLLGGATVAETVFAIPGVGLMVVNAVSRRDYPIIQGVLLLAAVVNVAINLLLDLAYLLVDPRIRYA